MAKNRSKSGSKKKRQKKYRGPGSTKSESDAEPTGGVMQSMVGGFRRTVGVEKPKKPGMGSKVWTALLILALAAVVYWRFFR
jgi:hypothetical protein